MELFEILFILLFIMIPVLEGIRKSRQRQSRGGAAERPDGPEPGWDDEPAAESDGQAADMLPDDLWEVLTGERRDRVRVPTGPHETDDEFDDHEFDDDDEFDGDELEEAPWRAEPVPEPVFAHPPPVRAVPAPSRYPRPPMRPVVRVPDAAAAPTAAAPLARTLRSPDGVRQAVLLAEVLGPPTSLRGGRRLF